MGLNLKFLTKSGPALGLESQRERSAFFNRCIPTASNIYPANRRQQQQKFSQPSGTLHKLQPGLGVTSIAHENAFHILGKKVRTEKTSIATHLSHYRKQERKEKKKTTPTHLQIHFQNTEFYKRILKSHIVKG